MRRHDDRPANLWRRFALWHLLLLSPLVTVGSLALYSASEGSWSPWVGGSGARAVGAGDRPHAGLH